MQTIKFIPSNETECLIAKAKNLVDMYEFERDHNLHEANNA